MTPAQKTLRTDSTAAVLPSFRGSTAAALPAWSQAGLALVATMTSPRLKRPHFFGQGDFVVCIRQFAVTSHRGITCVQAQCERATQVGAVVQIEVAGALRAAAGVTASLALSAVILAEATAHRMDVAKMATFLIRIIFP